MGGVISITIFSIGHSEPTRFTYPVVVSPAGSPPVGDGRSVGVELTALDGYSVYVNQIGTVHMNNQPQTWAARALHHVDDPEDWGSGPGATP